MDHNPAKRETGENPVRSRHCISGVRPICHWETGKAADAMTDEPGDLPAACHGTWIYPEEFEGTLRGSDCVPDHGELVRGWRGVAFGIDLLKEGRPGSILPFRSPFYPV